METLVYIGTSDKLRYIESLGFRTHFCSCLDQDTQLLTNAVSVVIDLGSCSREALQIFVRNFNSSNSFVPIILMGTDLDKEYLLWALRSRIWDFVIIPQELSHLKNSIERFVKLRQEPQAISNAGLPFNTENVAHKAREQRTSKAIEFITQNYSRKIALEELSSVCNMSPSALSRKFKKENGETIINFIIYYRLHIARQLLSGTAMTIKQVAFETGFEDVAYFTKTFRERVGQTPTAYREEQRTHSNAQISHNWTIECHG